MLDVRTGCRLHFGLMELAADAPLRFAGLGLMLSRPGYWLTIKAGPAASIALPHADATEVEQRIRAAIELRRSGEPSANLERLAHCQVQVQRALPLHSGLGAGTQLACAVACGLDMWLRHPSDTPSSRDGTTTQAIGDEEGWQPLPPDMTARELLRLSGRGLRSAIGLSGFQYGGLLLDEGYSSESSGGLAQRPLSAIATRLPSAWRVILVIPNCSERVHGRREAELLDQLGRTPHAHAPRMLQLARLAFELAQFGGDFVSFTDCLEQYMRFGAQLFYPIQNGLYNGPEVVEAVELAHSAGLRGVGQSSWGPTVFGFAEDPARADSIAKQLSNWRPSWTITTAVPAATGAQVRWLA